MAHELGNIKRKQNSPYIEIVHEATWNSAFCLALYLTGEHFRGVTARWWRQWAKNQKLTNQNSRSRWCNIVRGTVCILLLPNP